MTTLVDLSQQTAFVTGSGRGLGRAYTLALAGAGANVVVADIDEESAAETAELVRSETRSNPRAVRLDQSSEASVREAIEVAADAFGTVDILINNAALFSTLSRKSADEISIEEWNRVLDVNLTGPFLCARAVLPLMRERRSGKIVNIISTSVFGAKNRLAHYVTSKMGLLGLTRVLAREFGQYGICVNALSPGPTDSGATIATKEYLMERVAQKSIQRVQVPQDLIGAILFLSSPLSDFVTGQHLVVDGGAYFN